MLVCCPHCFSSGVGSLHLVVAGLMLQHCCTRVTRSASTPASAQPEQRGQPSCAERLVRHQLHPSHTDTGKATGLCLHSQTCWQRHAAGAGWCWGAFATSPGIWRADQPICQDCSWTHSSLPGLGLKSALPGSPAAAHCQPVCARSHHSCGVTFARCSPRNLLARAGGPVRTQSALQQHAA